MRATRNRVYGQPYQGFKSLRLRQDLYRNAVFFIEFLRLLWYNYSTNTMKRARRVRLFLSRPAGFFYLQKDKQNEITRILNKINNITSVCKQK